MTKLKSRESVAEPVVSRSQLLAVLVERCPRGLHSVFDLFCFLLLERDFLSKMSRTVSFCQHFNLYFFKTIRISTMHVLRMIFSKAEETHGLRVNFVFSISTFIFLKKTN